jgi:hypothetical protein
MGYEAQRLEEILLSLPQSGDVEDMGGADPHLNLIATPASTGSVEERYWHYDHAGLAGSTSAF